MNGTACWPLLLSCKSLRDARKVSIFIWWISRLLMLRLVYTLGHRVFKGYVLVTQNYSNFALPRTVHSLTINHVTTALLPTQFAPMFTHQGISVTHGVALYVFVRPQSTMESTLSRAAHTGACTCAHAHGASRACMGNVTLKPLDWIHQPVPFYRVEAGLRHWVRSLLNSHMGYIYLYFLFLNRGIIYCRKSTVESITS